MPIELADSFLASAWARRPGVSLKAAVLGAGFGKRLDPLTANHLPKPMFPLGGKVPIAEVWLRRIVESGFTDISLNVCVLKETIKRHFGNGAKFGIALGYVEEDMPSGTLGGVCKQVLGVNARRLAPGEPAVVLPAFSGSTVLVPSADIVTNLGADLIEEMFHSHRKRGAAFSLIVTPIPKERRGDFGTVNVVGLERRQGPLSAIGRVSDFIEKDPESPSILNNASIYMIELDLLKTLDGLRTPTDEATAPCYDFGKHVFPALLGKLPYLRLPKTEYPIWALQYDGGWFDVGNKRDYLRVNCEVLDRRLHVPIAYESLPWGYLGSNVSIDFTRAKIHAPVVIGNDCVVEPGATIGPYAVIGDGWLIEKGAHISHSVLWERYPFFPRGGDEISVNERRQVDRHEVRGVRVRDSIVAGGTITTDTLGKTLQVLEDGALESLPIDYVPAGPRA
jgi:NDP-sugar pyrophosphorylase family protein